MALDYDGGTSGIFTNLGKLVKHANLLGTDGSNLAADRDEIEDAFEAADLSLLVNSLSSSFVGLEQAHWSIREAISAAAELRLRDRVSVVNQLVLASDDIDTVLAGLVGRMDLDTETVDASAVTIGSVTAGAGNVGTGVVIADKVLDGVTAPGNGLKTFPALSSVNSELSKAETVTVTITDDSYSDGATKHQERAASHGDIVGATRWTIPEGGAGDGPTFQTALGENVVTNGDLESFNSHLPTGWTADSGTAGTHFQVETTQVDLGVKSLEFTTGNASLSQLVTVVPGAKYLLAIRYKAASTTTSGKKLICRFSGTGYTPSAGDKIEILGDVFSTSWANAYVWTVLPTVIPTDFKVVIESSGTLDVNVWVDSVQVVRPVWHNGVSIALLPGTTPFVKGDTWTFTLANNAAGTFQEFFRKQWGVQLPSDNAGAETILDSLAA